MSYKFNVFTNKLDLVRNVLDTSTRVYLGTTAYWEFDGNAVSLYINGILAAGPYSVTTSHAAGELMGALALTYPTSS